MHKRTHLSSVASNISRGGAHPSGTRRALHVQLAKHVCSCFPDPSYAGSAVSNGKGLQLVSARHHTSLAVRHSSHAANQSKSNASTGCSTLALAKKTAALFRSIHIVGKHITHLDPRQQHPFHANMLLGNVSSRWRS
jgi:hypothetical protein